MEVQGNLVAVNLQIRFILLIQEELEMDGTQ